MYLLLWITFGAFVGWIASLITNDNNRMGLIANVVVGLLGSLFGGLIASLLDFGDISTFSWPGFGFSILGAVLLLYLLRIFRKK